MKILHGSICDKHLFIWGEKSLGKDVSLPKRRAQKNPPPKPHPLTIPFDELTKCIGLEVEEKKALGWLPTLSGLPVPSSPLIGEQLHGKPALNRWAISGLPLSFDQISMFFHKFQQESIEKGLFLGKDLLYLQKVWRFALSLVVRERMLPSVQAQSRGIEAAWEPILIGRDQERFDILAKGMPSICRALSLSMKQQEPPCLSPQFILMQWIGHLIHAIVGLDKNVEKKDSIDEEWLLRLQNSFPSFKTEQAVCEPFLRRVNDWKRPLLQSIQTPFRLCMRLEEPEKEENWNISYHLQARDDPSLLVKVQEVWNPKGIKRKVLQRPGFDPRKTLISSLGIASGIASHIEESLKAEAPEGFELTSDETFSFLTKHAAALDDAGFGLILPKWWTGQNKIRAKALVKSPKMGATRRGSLWEQVTVDWVIKIGDHQLTLEELQALANLKKPLVQIHGEWVLLKQEELAKAIEFWKNERDGTRSLQDILLLSMGKKDQDSGISIDEVETDGWIEKLMNQLSGKEQMKALKVPTSFQGTLRPYQMRGYSWISFLRQWGLGACLADDMGLGKTPQTLASILNDWEQNKEKKPTLLVCPTSLTGNWFHEGKKFAPSLPLLVHHGNKRAKSKVFKDLVSKHSLVITSYGLLHRDFDLLNSVEWAGIILDEAQTIKNPETKLAKSAFSLKGDYRLALTGTPVENNVGDFWSMMHFINPGFLGSQKDFKETFFKPIQYNKDTKAIEQLKQMTAPFVLRRLKTDRTIIKDLPKKMEMDLFCSLTKEQISLYEATITDAQEKILEAEPLAKKAIILSTFVRLKQICNHPGQFLKDGFYHEERSGKMMRLLEMLKEVSSFGEKSLIFTQYREMGDILKEQLQETFGEEVLFLHGALSKKKRDEMVVRFQQKGGPKVFLLSLKAGGTGLNLTEANHVFHFDRWWNPAVENQATDRAFRIGQKKNVQVHKFICSGTMEERIAEMIEEKKAIADSIIGSGESFLTKLSTQDLFEMWKLRKETF